MGLGETLMKIVVRVSDVVELAKRFRAEPLVAMQEVVTQVRTAVAETLERVMDAEIDLVLGESGDPTNKRNGYAKPRSFGIKGIGQVTVKVPRDRKGVYESKVVPPSRRYDEAIERDLALLNLGGLSTRTLALVGSLSAALGATVDAARVEAQVGRPQLADPTAHAHPSEPERRIGAADHHERGLRGTQLDQPLDPPVHLGVVDQVVVLEDEADLLALHGLALLRRELVHGDVVEPVLALVRAVHHPEDVEQRALARTRRPHDRHELTRLDLQVDPAQHVDASLRQRVRLLDVLEADHVVPSSRECILF